MAVLREVLACEVWLQLGYATVLEYLEHELGYGPRAAYERLRVARELESLPGLDRALAQGQLTFCAVRELSRVATGNTEADWIARALGKSLRDVERMVVGHAKGDRPEDPIDHELLVERLTWEVRPSTVALVRQARQVLSNERGEHLEDDAFVAAMARSVIDSDGAERERAAHQIAVTVCSSCRRGWQDAAGVAFPLSAAEVERVQCDAQRIGSLDGDVPERASETVPPATRRLVVRRDRGRCAVPGCRASRHLEIHHVVPRSAGGTHEISNLVLLCDGHHTAHHDGTLAISGVAPDRLHFERRRSTMVGEVVPTWATIAHGGNEGIAFAAAARMLPVG